LSKFSAGTSSIQSP